MRVGTVFHRSHVPLWKWFLAIYVMAESPSGVPAMRLKRVLGVSYKTAWFLAHRIRAAMRDDATTSQGSVRGHAGRVSVSADHRFGRKHLPAYLDEIAFRSNNRNNPYLLRDTLVRLLNTETLPYRELVSRT